MILTVLFLFSLSPQLQNVLSRIQTYPFAPHPSAGFVRELVFRKGNGATFRVAYRREAK